MVDVAAIEKRLLSRFKIVGVYHIEPQTGVVDVEGSVRMTRSYKNLGLTFGEVTGFFLCEEKQLETLAGAPHKEGGDCYLTRNKLTNLEGAPSYVGGIFACGYNRLENLTHGPYYVGIGYYCHGNLLNSLEGIPSKLQSINVSWNPHIPLLRSLCAQRIGLDLIAPYSQNYVDSLNKVEPILNKYAGQGKAGTIKCAAELIKAGFKENARW